MADISDNGAFSLGLANLASQNFGPNAITSQANTASNTAFTQQQALAASIQNQNARWQFTQLQNGVAAVNDFSGQGGPTIDHSNGTDPHGFPLPKSSGASFAESGGDQSGTSASRGARAAQPDQSAQGGRPNDQSSDDQKSQPRGAAPSPTQSIPAQAPASPEDGLGSSASDEAKIQSTLDSQLNVNAAGSDREQHAIAQASMQAAQAKLLSKAGPYGEGLSASADAKVEALKTVRDQNVKDQQNANQLYASKEYDKFSAIESAPKDKAWATLEAVAPNSAEKILKNNPDATPEELDEIARDTAGHWSAFLHRYTNREVVTGDDGATYDKVTGMRVDGVPVRGVKNEQQAELLKQANTLVTKPNSDGSQTTKTQAEWDGYANPNLWVTHAIAQIKSNNSAQNQLTAAGIHAAQFGHITPGAPPAPGGTLYRGPQPGDAPQPGAPAAQRPTSTPAAGAAALNARMLSGQDGAPINLDTMPKVNLPTPVRGRTPNPEEKAQLDAFGENYKGMQTDAMRKLSETNQADALLTPFQQKLNTINPRDVGPGSPAYKALLDFKSAVTGKAPEDLVDMGVLDKFANQLGVQNVRQLLSGQRITNQEMMNFLTRASASVTQPIDVMKTIVSYQKANNDFDRRLATTQLAGLSKHVDPVALQGLENGREAYVAQSMRRDGFGGAPPTRSGQQSSGQSSSATAAPIKVQSRADVMKLAPGTVFMTPDGRQLVR